MTAILNYQGLNFDQVRPGMRVRPSPTLPQERRCGVVTEKLERGGLIRVLEDGARHALAWHPSWWLPERTPFDRCPPK